MKCTTLAYQLVAVLSFVVCLHAAQKPYYSQYGQDEFVYNTFFKDQKTGMFIEIGANNGTLFSNSCFFERTLGWQGICVEPMPAFFKELQKNRKCMCIKGCITDAPGWKEFLVITGYCQMLSGIIDKYDPRHMERIEKELVEHGGTKEVIRVECFRLMDILKDLDIKKVDYISIDTEGGEFEILQSLDYDAVEFSVIGVENNYNTTEMRDFLESKGYRYITRLGCDEIYKKES